MRPLRRSSLGAQYKMKTGTWTITREGNWLCLNIRGGGGNLTCLWYGVVPFLGYIFHDRFRIYGYGFQQFFGSSGFMDIVFCRNSLTGELFWHSRIYGYTFEKFLRIYGWYDLNGTILYLGNSSYPPGSEYFIVSPRDWYLKTIFPGRGSMQPLLCWSDVLQT